MLKMCNIRCFHSQEKEDDNDKVIAGKDDDKVLTVLPRKPGGWKSMPYIIGMFISRRRR